MNDDTISRQAAIDAVSRGCQELRGIFAECEKNLNALPSAERRGWWKFNIDDKGWSWEMPYVCDQCGKWNGIETPYCPHCGAKMDGEEK